uniref:Uncharacterized protein n=1 Tax=Pipistrellus kuhlii TaxID=59472 RepID=A0A7J7ZKB3_PIPKU|nr:hypothetical protein mPipKuh1_009389 [Pipistrellus kuhlii]
MLLTSAPGTFSHVSPGKALKGVSEHLFGSWFQSLVSHSIRNAMIRKSRPGGCRTHSSVLRGTIPWVDVNEEKQENPCPTRLLQEPLQAAPASTAKRPTVEGRGGGTEARVNRRKLKRKRAPP